jgi:hypothetical protein
LLVASHLPIEAISAATGLTSDELNGELVPSELDDIWRAVEEVNGFLSSMMLRLRDVAEELMALQKSSGPPAP